MKFIGLEKIAKNSDLYDFGIQGYKEKTVDNPIKYVPIETKINKEISWFDDNFLPDLKYTHVHGKTIFRNADGFGRLHSTGGETWIPTVYKRFRDHKNNKKAKLLREEDIKKGLVKKFGKTVFLDKFNIEKIKSTGGNEWFPTLYNKYKNNSSEKYINTYLQKIEKIREGLNNSKILNQDVFGIKGYKDKTTKLYEIAKDGLGTRIAKIDPFKIVFPLVVLSAIAGQVIENKKKRNKK